MKSVDFCEYINLVTEKMRGNGVFLTVGSTPNTMTMGWGSIGYFWGQPVFIVPVRYSRFTHSLLENSDEFTVSVPLSDMKKELAFCGSKSGRDVDKIAALGLKTHPSRSLNTPIILNAGLHFECRVIFKTDCLEADLPASFKAQWYPDNNFHTLYFGQIIDCYTE
jgi:flavin reductase (DIM6/NTAB) family NADH-FMN oxidoreductase RutF